MLRGSDSAIDFVRLHGREIEEQDNDAAIFKLILRAGGGRRGSSRVCRLRQRARQRLRLSHILRRYGVDVLHIERVNFLRLVVLENRKVPRLEPADKVSILVSDRYIHQHQFGLHPKGVVGRLLRGQGRTHKSQLQQHRQNPGRPSVRNGSRHHFLFSPQKRNRAVIVICRMAPTAVTRPNVGELNVVSIDEKLGMLTMLVACARNSRTRDSLIGITLVSAMSKTLLPGPMMLLRRASPYGPAGNANAAVLNHFAIEGFEMLTDCPRTTSGRSVPFVPRFTSAESPSSRGVKGSPEAIVQSPLHCQSPKMARSGVFPVSQRLSCPKGSSNK